MTNEGAKEVADAIRRLAAAVTPNIQGTHDATGGHVESLTEAVMGMTAALVQISHRLEEIKDEMSGMGSTSELVDKLDEIKDEMELQTRGMGSPEIVDKLDEIRDELEKTRLT